MILIRKTKGLYANTGPHPANDLSCFLPFGDGVTDISRGRKFTLNNPAGFDNSPVGRALSFNGTGTYAVSTDTTPFSIGTTGLTVTLLVKFNSIPPDSVGNRMWLLSKSIVNEFEWGISVNSYNGNYGKIVAAAWSNNGLSNNTWATTTLPSTGVWYHLGIVFPPSNTDSPKIYLNGRLDGANTNQENPTYTTTTGFCHIGTLNTYPENYLDGSLANLKIFKAVLPISLIQEDFINPFFMYPTDSKYAAFSAALASRVPPLLFFNRAA